LPGLSWRDSLTATTAFRSLGFVLVRPVQCKAEDDDEGDWEVSYTALTTYWPDGKSRLKLQRRCRRPARRQRTSQPVRWRVRRGLHRCLAKSKHRADSLQSHGEIKLEISNRFNSDRVPSGPIFPAITTLVVEPLFSGFPESIFHADPYAGNLMVQTQKHPSFTLVLPDWRRDGPALCAAALPLIVRGSFCGKEEMLCICKKLVDSLRKSMRRFLLKLRNYPEPPSQEKKRKKT